MDGRWRQALILLLGVGAVVLASILGRTDVPGAVLEPPLIGRLLLGGAAALVGVVLVLRAVDRFGRASGDPRALIRAVRLIFLAIAAFAASAGWFLGSALPIVVALVIAGIDVIETTVLLLVTQVKGGDEQGSDESS
jgi:hypothetical protein